MRSVRTRWTFGLMTAFLTLAVARQASAHPEGFSGALIIVGAQSVRIELSIHTRDLGDWFPPALSPDDVCRDLEKQSAELYELRLNNVPAKLASARAFQLEPGLIQVDLDYPYAGALENLKAEFLQFRKLPRKHQQYLIVTDDRGAAFKADPYRLLVDTIDLDQPMSAKDIPSRFPATLPATSPATAPASAPATAPAAFDPGLPPETEVRVNWFLDGLGHILFGYDHLLFIAALLVVCRNFREAATIVTFFTVAHSITLALSAMKLVNISGEVIEPAIAATIVIVAVENLVHQPKLAWRCLITLVFGLIHGLGFAKDLREKLASDSFAEIAWPLLQFSAGVESGHLALVGAALPLLLWFKRREPSFDRVAMPTLSVLIGLMGAFWLVTRVWGTLHTG